MPFKFKFLVQLLEDLVSDRRKSQSWSTSRQQESHTKIIERWFQLHASSIIRHGQSAVALLSCLLLDHLPHRVYGLREKTLARVVSKCLGITGTDRAKHLQQCQRLDFATCLEKHVMEPAGPPTLRYENNVTLEEIDDSLQELAKRSQFASKIEKEPSSRPGGTTYMDVQAKILTPMFRRMSALEAKWLVRIILKSFQPIELPEHVVMGCFHFLLPNIMPYRHSIEEAVAVLDQADVRKIPHDPVYYQRPQYRHRLPKYMQPKLGVMVKRQDYLKGRTVKGAHRQCQGRKMSVERKYDGYYCQIHIDQSNIGNEIQIFAKSGKDATEPRYLWHKAIHQAFHLGSPNCLIQQNGIFDAEMVVWSQSSRKILAFDKVRKYVEYSGRRIGATADSPPSSDEQMMLVFYDCLWHDDRNFVGEPLHVRRQELERLVTPQKGLAMLGERKIIDTAAIKAQHELQEYFTHANTLGWEGLVLKGHDLPFFSDTGYTHGIKLKKDDLVDLCILGARWDAEVASIQKGTHRWTTFHIGCLLNKEEVLQKRKPAEYLLLAAVEKPCLPDNILVELNKRGLGRYVPYSVEHASIHIDQPELQARRPQVVFMRPFAAEVLGMGFTKPQDVSYYSPRFPRLHRVYYNRDTTETNSFDELQDLAKGGAGTSDLANTEPQAAEDDDEAADEDSSEQVQRSGDGSDKRWLLGFENESETQHTPARDSPSDSSTIATMRGWYQTGIGQIPSADVSETASVASRSPGSQTKEPSLVQHNLFGTTMYRAVQHGGLRAGTTRCTGPASHQPNTPTPIGRKPCSPDNGSKSPSTVRTVTPTSSELRISREQDLKYLPKHEDVPQNGSATKVVLDLTIDASPELGTPMPKEMFRSSPKSTKRRAGSTPLSPPQKRRKHITAHALSLHEGHPQDCPKHERRSGEAHAQTSATEDDDAYVPFRSSTVGDALGIKRKHVVETSTETNNEVKVDTRFKKPKIPLHAITFNTNSVNPYDPPAVFGSAVKSSQRSSTSDSPIRRQPLGEITNPSPTRGLYRMPPSTSEKSRSTDAIDKDERCNSHQEDREAYSTHLKDIHDQHASAVSTDSSASENVESHTARTSTTIKSVSLALKQRPPTMKFEIDNVLCKALGFDYEKITSFNFDLETPGIYVALVWKDAVDIKGRDVDRKVQSLEDKIKRSYEGHWRSLQKHTASAKTLPTPPPTDPELRPQEHRLVLYYSQEILPLLRNRTQKARDVLQDDNNWGSFKVGVVVTTRQGFEHCELRRIVKQDVFKTEWKAREDCWIKCMVRQPQK